MSPTLAGIRVAVVTVSDRSFAGAREDLTGPALCGGLAAVNAHLSPRIVPDDASAIAQVIEDVIADGARAVVTTGGTGIGPRDVTPEATAPLIAVPLPGIPELLRQRDAGRTPLVALSRGLAGLTAHEPPALIINLPGSMSAVESALEVLPALIAHAIAQVDGGDH